MIKELQHSSYSVVQMQLKPYQCSINNAKLSCCPATWWQFWASAQRKLACYFI